MLASLNKLNFLLSILALPLWAADDIITFLKSWDVPSCLCLHWMMSDFCSWVLASSFLLFVFLSLQSPVGVNYVFFFLINKSSIFNHHLPYLLQFIACSVVISSSCVWCVCVLTTQEVGIKFPLLPPTSPLRPTAQLTRCWRTVTLSHTRPDF